MSGESGQVECAAAKTKQIADNKHKKRLKIQKKFPNFVN